MNEREGFHTREDEENSFTFERQFGLPGFQAFKEFVGRLRVEHPDLAYPTDEVLDHIGPERNRELVTYLVQDEAMVIGAVIGNAEGNRMRCFWFIIDPNHQNTVVAKQLLEPVAADFDEVVMLASVKDVAKDADSDARASRQNALVRYYERLGFVPDVESESFRYSKLPGGPMPMVWKRPGTEKD